MTDLAVPPAPLPTPTTNWAGNYRYQAARFHRPATVDAVRELVAASDALKVLGSRHSFNGVADTTGDLVSLERLDRVVALDPAARTVTVEGGIRYGELARALAASGWALHNLASLPHISVAGACATATHGSGDENAGLAAAVSALEFVAADGDVVSLSRARDGDAFRGAVVALGALGPVTRLTLGVRPAYDVEQRVYEDVPLGELAAGLDEVFGHAYSVSVFTTWRGPRAEQVWVKRRVEAAAAVPNGAARTAPGALPTALPAALLGAAAAAVARHPVPGMSAVHCTEQLGVPGPWHDRLPHFRLEFTPSAGDELQTDYLVPREHARAALGAVDGLRDRIAPLVQVSELRSVAADDLWLSPFNGRACLSFHFTWKPDWPAVRALLPAIEAALAPFDARPHWGKLFTVAPARVRALYPQLPAFRELALTYDPRGKFRNVFLDAYVFGA